MRRETTSHIIKPGAIILIDDDPIFRKETKGVLEDEDYQVMALDSGSHAIRYMQNQAWSWYPWLVITDLVMDGMGGYQLLRRIGELYPNKTIPVIVVSRLGSAEDIAEAEIAGAAAYLKKPIQAEKLLATIKKVTTKENKESNTKPPGVPR